MFVEHERMRPTTRYADGLDLVQQDKMLPPVDAFRAAVSKLPVCALSLHTNLASMHHRAPVRMPGRHCPHGPKERVERIGGVDALRRWRVFVEQEPALIREREHAARARIDAARCAQCALHVVVRGSLRCRIYYMQKGSISGISQSAARDAQPWYFLCSILTKFRTLHRCRKL